MCYLKNPRIAMRNLYGKIDTEFVDDSLWEKCYIESEIKFFI